MRELGGWVCILASKRNGTLYAGLTNLLNRVAAQREGVGSKFTRKYGATLLVWFELHDSDRVSYSAGSVDQALPAQMEAGLDREGQSRVAGSIRNAGAVMFLTSHGRSPAGWPGQVPGHDEEQ